MTYEIDPKKALEELIRLAKEAEAYTYSETVAFYNAAKTFADTVAPELLQKMQQLEARNAELKEENIRIKADLAATTLKWGHSPEKQRELEARNAKLVEVLKFYSDPRNFFSTVEFGIKELTYLPPTELMFMGYTARQ